MRIALSLFSFVALANISIAQITINSSDFPGVGTSLYQGIDTVLPIGFSIGTGSPDPVAVDLQPLETDSLYEFTFHDPTTVPNGTDFPDAEVAVDQFGGAGFVNLTSSVAEIIGVAADNFQGLPVNLSAPFDDPYQLLSFPSTYGTAFTDQAVLDITLFNDGFVPSFPPLFDPDSVRLKRTSSITSEIIGHGPVTDPLGNLHHSLRQFFVEESVDSLWYYQNDVWAMVPALVFENPSLDTVRSVRLLSLQLGYAVADFDVDENMVPQSATFLSDPSLCCTSVEEITQAEFDLAYPNPTNGSITLNNVDAGSTFELLDLSGKQVYSSTIKTGSQKLNLSSLPNGLYIFKLIESNGLIRTGRLSLAK